MASANVAYAKIVSAQALSADFTSPITNLQNQHVFSYIIQTSGVTANTGTFKVQHRIVDDRGNASDWIDFPSMTATLADADADAWFYTQAPLATSQLRVVFTLGTGTDGTVDIYVKTSRVGA